MHVDRVSQLAKLLVATPLLAREIKKGVNLRTSITDFRPILAKPYDAGSLAFAQLAAAHCPFISTV